MDKPINFKKIRSRWGLTRIVQLLIGGVFFLSGMSDRDYGLAALGAFFLLLAFMNAGCGAMGASSCELNKDK